MIQCHMPFMKNFPSFVRAVFSSLAGTALMIKVYTVMEGSTGHSLLDKLEVDGAVEMHHQSWFVVVSLGILPV